MNESKDRCVEAALNEIGWQKAKLINPSLYFQMLPDEHGGLLFKSKTEADKSAKAIDDLCKSLKTFLAVESRLTKKQRFAINYASAEPQEYETGEFQDRLAEAVVALGAIKTGVAEARIVTKHEHSEEWSGRSASKKSPAYRVAAKLAKIYVLGEGKKPTYYMDHGEPSTLYARITRRVFDLRGIKSGIRGPCLEAIAGLTNARMKNLMDQQKRGGRRISLITGRLCNKSRRI